MDEFSVLLYQRSLQQRKLSNQPFSPVAQLIVKAVVQYPELIELVDEQIDQILKDCQIYHDMPEKKAIDAMIELASLASLYVNRRENVYNQICHLLKQLQASYPARF